MLDILIDAIVDVLKLIPFLFLAFLLLEFIEHKMSAKSQKYLVNNRKLGPFLGGILGSFPQCGFSAMVTRLFSSRVVTLGTLIAVYLSTSDEMLPVLLSQGVSILIVLKLIGIKVVIGIIIGYLIDLIYRKKSNYNQKIHSMCHDDECHCEKGIIHSSIHHTLNITLYLFIATLMINVIIYFIGEENISHFLENSYGLKYFISSLIGLIPNCASSIIITEIYLEGVSSLGMLLSGLLTASGVGLLVLFKTNKNLKENITVLLIIYFIGVICGYLIDLLGIVIS